MIKALLILGLIYLIGVHVIVVKLENKYEISARVLEGSGFSLEFIEGNKIAKEFKFN